MLFSMIHVKLTIISCFLCDMHRLIHWGLCCRHISSSVKLPLQAAKLQRLDLSG